MPGMISELNVLNYHGLTHDELRSGVRYAATESAVLTTNPPFGMESLEILSFGCLCLWAGS